jgi:Na+-transporting NADH:ubiquinone oxidoreductase subunit NqrD
MPKWLNDAVFYEIYPQSFYDTVGYMNNGMMTMSCTALILIGVVIWINRAFFAKDDK